MENMVSIWLRIDVILRGRKVDFKNIGKRDKRVSVRERERNKSSFRFAQSNASFRITLIGSNSESSRKTPPNPLPNSIILVIVSSWRTQMFFSLTHSLHHSLLFIMLPDSHHRYVLHY